MGPREMSLMVGKLIGDDESAFERLAANELHRMHAAGVIKGGKDTEGEGVGSAVAVEPIEAQRRGFSAEAIGLAEDLAALTNEIVATLSAESPAIGPDSVGLESFPGAAAFFAAASVRRTTAGDEAPGEDSVDSEEDDVDPQIFIPGVSHAVCGYYPNPKPRRAVEPSVWDVPDPAATLRGWGYHETPDLAGGGWTRPQTWKPLVCSVKTFRDHAYIRPDGRISEQNYTGSPNGEPNPEIWASGPWPYPDWPAYVLWWHQTR